LRACTRPAKAVEVLCAARPAVADYLEDRDFAPAVTAAYGEIFDRLRPLADRLPERPLHGDWQTNNLFFHGDGISSIIDFHQADYAPRVLDLAVAVERNCFFWNRISEGDDAALDLRHAGILIEAYHGVGGLAREELQAFPDVLAACQFEYGISFLDYYWGIESDHDKADWAWETFVLGHANWWRSAAGRAARATIEQIVAGLTPSRERSTHQA
jgi:Ser/Thr protein kinase RdoA (MazF antagonist)